MRRLTEIRGRKMTPSFEIRLRVRTEGLLKILLPTLVLFLPIIALSIQIRARESGEGYERCSRGEGEV